MKTYLAMDVGGSKYMVALINAAGEILCKSRGEWDTLSEEIILYRLLNEARVLMATSGVQPAACGVTIPGLADPERGLWVEASFSGIRDFAICEALSAALGIPAWCENDGQAYALAEMWCGACKTVKDFLFVNVSNGIGGAIVSGGRLLNGSRGFAGEFGHCNVVPGGRLCKCGSRGCLEMHAAGPGIARTYAETSGQQADCREIARRAHMGDCHAIAAFEEAGRCLGKVIAMAVNLLNPAKVVFGGGVALAFDLFAPALRCEMETMIYQGANPDIQLLPTPLGYDAGLYGAAAIAMMHDESKEEI